MSADANTVTIITPVGMIGYGYPIQPFLAACENLPEGSFIIADAGSTDGGPLKLCFGSMTCTWDSYLRDFAPMLKVAHERKFKLLLSSAGGAGANTHVEKFVAIIDEICKREGYSFKLAKIFAEVDKAFVSGKLAKAVAKPCGPLHELDQAEVDAANCIVAQMGAEPIIKALEGGADIVIAGRAYDPSPYAAVCLMHGIDEATAWHMGKIMECGALCAVPKGRTIVATVQPGSFELTPVAQDERCTPLSVAAHTLYEKSRPDVLVGPGGRLLLLDCKYEPLSEKTTRVSGAIFERQPYTVKLEGAKPLGFRTVFWAGIRDPILVRQIEDVLETVKEHTFDMIDEYDEDVDRLVWHVYGKNGVMGALEPDYAIAQPMEVAVLGEVLSSSQRRANQIAGQARIGLLHCPYPGQMATSGNVGLPYSPFEQEIGAHSEFNIYHTIPIDDPLALFPIEYVSISHPPIEGRPNGHAKTNGHVNGKPNGHAKKAVKPRVTKTVTKPTFNELIQSGRTKAAVAEIASVVRSKNAGPFELTLDVMFEKDEEYEWVKKTNVFNVDVLATAYNIPPTAVVTCMFFDPARAFKLTIPRPRVQGGFGETDMHGAQQFIPLARLSVPLPSAVTV